MWPDVRTAELQTINGEHVLEVMFNEVFQRWVPLAFPSAFPQINDPDSPLPPDPDAFVSTTALSEWDRLYDEWMVPAMTMLWSLHFLEAVSVLGPTSLVAAGDDLTPQEFPFPSPPPNPSERTQSRRKPRTQEEIDALLAEEAELSRAAEQYNVNIAAHVTKVLSEIGELPTEEEVKQGIIKGPRNPIKDLYWQGFFGPVDNPWPTPAAPVEFPQYDDLVTETFARAMRQNPGLVREATLTVWKMDWTRPEMLRYISSSRTLAHTAPRKLRDVIVGELSVPGSTRKSELTSEAVKYWMDLYSRPANAMYAPSLSEIPTVAKSQASGVINDALLKAVNNPWRSDKTPMDKVWVSHMDARTRKTHYIADGQRVPLDGKFTVGGTELSYPGEFSGPASETRNCRCRFGVLEQDKPLPGELKRTKMQLREIAYRSAVGQVRAREDPDGIGYLVGTDINAIPNKKPKPIEVLAASGQESGMGKFRTFTDAVIAFVGSPTSDRRMLSSSIELKVRTPPLPLMWMRQSQDGHASAFTVGVIESAQLTDAGTIVASGYLLNSPEADEAADQLAHGVTRPSVDLASVSWITTDRDGNEVTEDSYTEGTDLYMTMTSAELIGTTLVSTPAFGDTSLPLNADRESRDFAVVAAATTEFSPRVYDHRLFENPKLSGPTAPTMGEDGRIYGHLACFGECHRSIQTECVLAPRSRTNYAHFHTSPAVRLDTGEFLPVGRLTVGTGHAPSSASPRVAAAHYDNTGSCFALVRVGEDEHGIWFSGVTAPWATPEQIEMGLSSPLSGDWRDFGQGLELVAALAVNTPGFAIAQGRSDEQGRPVSLVASLGPVNDDNPATLSVDAIKAAVKEALGEVKMADIEASRKKEMDAILQRSFAITKPRTPSEEIADLLASRQ